MQIAKRITIIVMLVLLTVGPSQSAEEPAKRISNTRTANCLVKITCDPAILPPDSHAVDYLLHSSAIGGKASREVLGLSSSADNTYGLFTIRFLQLSSSKVGAEPMGSPMGGPQAEEGMDDYAAMMDLEMGMEAMPLAPTPAPGSPNSGARSSYGVARTPRTLRTPRRTPSATSPALFDSQTRLFGLNVNLPEDVKPAAREFLSALVENLRRVLLNSYGAHVDELRSQLSLAEHNRDKIEAQLAETTSQIEAVKVTPPIGVDLGPADVAVREQLETIVDLSNFSQSMSFEEVLTELKNSVDPPLQIQPIWKDLLETADLEPTTPALMDPLTGVKLRKALELLLAGLSSNSAELGYVVDEGVVVIATKESLPKRMVTHVYEIPVLAHSQTSARGLVRTIQESVEPDSWFDLSDAGEGTISVSMGNKLVIHQTCDVHERIFQFLRSVTVDVPASATLQVPPEMLLGEKRDLLREKQGIEMDIARVRARQSAIEMQIVQIKDQAETKAEPDPVITELEQLIRMHTEQLALMEKQYEAGRLAGNELADVKEKLTRAKIDLAKRRHQMSLPSSSARVEKYNDELADLTIELAEKTAALQILDKQLGQTDQQLTAATMIDPRLSRICMATRAFEMADERVNELNTRIVNLRPPVVSILGGE